MDAVCVDPLFPQMSPDSAVFPTVRVIGDEVYLAYHLPACDDSVVVAFEGVASWRYGGPNDEGLSKHPLWGRGLSYYNFHRAVGAERGDVIRWIATFHDGTFDVLARSARVISDRVSGARPSQALTTLLGHGHNRVLDHERAF